MQKLILFNKYEYIPRAFPTFTVFKSLSHLVENSKCVSHVETRRLSLIAECSARMFQQVAPNVKESERKSAYINDSFDRSNLGDTSYASANLIEDIAAR